MKKNTIEQSLTLGDIIKSWDKVIEHLDKKNSKVAHFLEDAKLCSFDGEQILIEIINGQKFHLKTLGKDAGQIESIMKDILNQEVKIKFKIQDNSTKKKIEKVDSPLSIAKSDVALELLDTKALLKVVSDRLQTVDEEFTEYREENKNKIDFYDRLSESENTLDFSQAAKLLNFENYGRNKLILFCREYGFLRNRPGTPAHNEPYQRYIDQGLFEVVVQPYIVNGKENMGTKTVVTQKGLEYIRKLLDEYTNGE